MVMRLAAFIFLIIFLVLPGKGQDKPIPVSGFSEFQNKLNNKSDTVYVINFWATWCAPCRKELPEFEKIYKSYKNDKVRVLLVSLDFPKQIKSLREYLSVNKITAPVILLNEPDANSWIDRVDPSWSGALPATLIYKNDERRFYEKELTYQEILNSISTL